MYLKKADGPIFVTDHQGGRISRADLPPPDTTRWVARRKATVANAVRGGLLSIGEACELYDLSEEELAGWISQLERHGARALRATAVQCYRDVSDKSASES